jgi:hypothetical protein
VHLTVCKTTLCKKNKKLLQFSKFLNSYLDRKQNFWWSLDMCVIQTVCIIDQLLKILYIYILYAEICAILIAVHVFWIETRSPFTQHLLSILMEFVCTSRTKQTKKFQLSGTSNCTSATSFEKWSRAFHVRVQNAFMYLHEHLMTLWGNLDGMCVACMLYVVMWVCVMYKTDCWCSNVSFLVKWGVNVNVF